MHTSSRNDDIQSSGVAFPGSTAKQFSKELLVAHFLSCQKRNSRTMNGISDTSTSSEKKPLKLTGKELADGAARNVELQLTVYLGLPKFGFDSPESATLWVAYLSQKINLGLSNDESQFFRNWETGRPGQPSPDRLQIEFISFGKKLFTRYTSIGEHPVTQDIVSLAAWVEKEFNGRIHPLDDGCGRTSKVIAAIILGRGGLPYPTFSSRDEFFDHINLSEIEWSEFYRNRVELSLKSLTTAGSS